MVECDLLIFDKECATTLVRSQINNDFLLSLYRGFCSSEHLFKEQI